MGCRFWQDFDLICERTKHKIGSKVNSARIIYLPVLYSSLILGLNRSSLALRLYVIAIREKKKRNTSSKKEERVDIAQYHSPISTCASIKIKNEAVPVNFWDGNNALVHQMHMSQRCFTFQCTGVYFMNDRMRSTRKYRYYDPVGFTSI